MQALVRLSWKLSCSIFVQYAISVYKEIGVSQKNMAAISQLSSSTY